MAKTPSYLESVPQVAVVQCVYTTSLKHRVTEGQDTPSPNSFPMCCCMIAASRGNLQHLAERFTSTNSNTILVRTENNKTHFV